MSRSLRPSLPFSPPKSRSHPGREPSQHSLSVSSLFFRTPCEVANASCLIRTRHARINLSKWRRPNRRHSNYGCLVKVAFFRSPLLITIDTQQRAIDDEAPDRDCPTLLPHLALPGAILLGRRGTTLSADKKDVGDAPRGRPRGAARVTAIA